MDIGLFAVEMIIGMRSLAGYLEASSDQIERTKGFGIRVLIIRKDGSDGDRVFRTNQLQY